MFQTRSGFHDQIVILQSHSLIDSVIKHSNFHVQYFSVNRVLGFRLENEIYLDAPFRVFLNSNGATQYNEPVTITLESPSTFRLHDNSNLGISEQSVGFGQVFANDSIAFSILLSDVFNP